MLSQAQFAKYVDEGNPDFGNFDDKNAEVDVRKTNPFITCPLCSGYLINAMSFEECGHTFCKSCIVAKLNTDSKNCPECNRHVTLNNLKSDNTLQEIVYKLVPGLLEDELKNEREFWENRGVPLKNSKSHLLKIDEVQKMLGQDVDSNEEESATAAAYYNKHIHDETIEGNAKFDGIFMFLCKVNIKGKSLPDKCIAVPLRVKFVSVIKVLAKEYDINLSDQILRIDHERVEENMLITQVARLLEPTERKHLKAEQIVINFTVCEKK